MACIIATNTKKFIKDLCKDYNPHNFQLVLVSKDITTEGRYDNVYAATELMPSKEAFNARINAGEFDFNSKYVAQLKENPDTVACLATIVKSVVNHKKNIILLCSDTEYEYGYLDTLAHYLEKVFKISVYSVQNLKKKGDKLLKKSPKNEEEIEKNLLKVIDDLKSNTVDKKSKSKNKTLKEYTKLVTKECKKKYLYKMLTKFSDFDEDKDACSKKDLIDVCLEFGQSLPENKVNKLVKYLKKQLD